MQTGTCFIGTESTMNANRQLEFNKETNISSSQVSSRKATYRSAEYSSHEKSGNSYGRLHSSETTSSKADSAFGELDTSIDQGNDSISRIFATEVRTSKSVISDEKETCDGDSWFVPENREFDSSIKFDFQTESIGDNEEALKSELLHIFERERMTLEQYFKNRMEELLRSFRSKQREWEENSRAGRVQLEDSMAQEKLEMQRNFGEEIAKLTRTFNEERIHLEQYYKQQMNELRDHLRLEQQEMNEKIAREKLELKEKLDTEYQAMLRAEITDSKQLYQQEKTALESEFSKIKLEMERRHNLEISEAETSLQRQNTELESRLAQEKIKFERELREQLRELENKLQRERDSKHEAERLLEQAKSNSDHGDSLRKQEIECLKCDLERIRFELDERNKSTLEIKKFEENILVKGKDGLPGKLKEDFDKLLSQYKSELDRNYQRDREALEQSLERRLQTERQTFEEENFREREKIRDEMYREREKSREETKREREELEVSMKKRFDDEKAQIEERMTKEKEIEIERTRSEQSHYSTDIQSQYTEKQVHSMSSTWGQEHDHYLTRPGANKVHQHTAPRPSSPSGDFAIPSTREDSLHSAGGRTSDAGYTNPHRHPDSSRHDEQDGNTFSRFINVDEETRGSRDENMPQECVSHNSFYVSAENENSLRIEINELRRENEGLKAKIKALEENIELHKTYKAEVKSELERVEQKNHELEGLLNQINSDGEKSEERSMIEVELQNGEYERQLRECMERVEESEEKAQMAERKAWEVEMKLQEWEKRATEADEKVQELQSKLRNVGEGTQNYEKRNHCHRHHDAVILRGVVERDQEGKARNKLNRLSEKDKDKILIAFIKGDIRKVQHSGKGSERQRPAEKSKENDRSYKEKHELTQREKEKLLQSVKYLQQQVKALEDNQDKSYGHGLLQVGHAHEEGGAMNSSLKENIRDLQRKLQILEERLKQENESVSSSSKSKYLREIRELQSQIDRTGREINSSVGEDRLDIEILRRIEKELVSVSQFIKGYLSRDSEAGVECSSQRSASASRLMQLEFDKQELEFKLKMAKDAMSDYVARLNEKMSDIESSGNMSESMLHELRTRNSNLKKTIQALEDGQKRSHLQNEQLLQHKSTLQQMICKLCTDGDVTSCASLKPSPSPHWSRDDDLGFSSKFSDHNFSQDIDCCSF